MQAIYKSIGRVASTDATVLIRGESGTGKELVARAIYQHSLRADRPFTVINCVAIPETLLESELFGYEKGAFTGAVHRRIGKIEQANRGTLLLDEIGDMPFKIQSKILRLLQEKSIERLGGRESIPVDVRIIAATNRDLESAIGGGRFREDLYYRLNVVTINLPPLRERLGDLPLLVDYFLNRYSHQLGIENPGISKAALSELKAYAWPGNVRELSNTVQKSLIFNRGTPLQPEDIHQAVTDRSDTSADPRAAEGIIRGWIRSRLQAQEGLDMYDRLMGEYASIVVSEALVITDGNRSRAAKLLGMSRPTLHAKIDKYHLKVKTAVEENRQ
jgi:DNA-binding NtrC family response regulator